MHDSILLSAICEVFSLLSLAARGPGAVLLALLGLSRVQRQVRRRTSRPTSARELAGPLAPPAPAPATLLAEIVDVLLPHVPDEHDQDEPLAEGAEGPPAPPPPPPRAPARRRQKAPVELQLVNLAGDGVLAPEVST